MNTPKDPGEVLAFPRIAPASRFKREDFDTLKPGDQQWTVKGLWPRAGVCFVAGPSMSGKSFWTLDALAHVVKGEDVLGRKSKACGVLYIAAEGAAGVRNRIKALRDEKTGPLGGAFELIGQAPNLTDEDDVEDLRQAILEARDSMKSRGHRLGIVALDTLSASIPGADENAAKDMSPVLSALQALALDLDVMVLVVAHTGKDQDRGLRGWSGLMANADGLIMMAPRETDQDRLCSGTVVKVKDGMSGDRFGFELETTEIGRDEDGDPITSCLVRDTDAPAGQKAVSRRLTSKLEAVLRAVALCVEAGQVETVTGCPGVPAGTEGVRRDVLRAKLTEIGFTAGTANPDSIRKSMNRTIDDLIGREELRGTPDMVWRV